MNHHTPSEQMIKPLLKRILTAASICIGLASCGSMPSMDEVFPDRKNDYQETQEIPPLEVPPGLSGATLTSDQMPVRRRAPAAANDEGFDSPYGPQPTQSNDDEDRATVYGDAAYEDDSDLEYLASEDSAAMAIPLQDYPLDDSDLPQAAAEEIQHYVLYAEASPPYIQSDEAYSTVWENTGKAIALAGYQVVDSKPDSGAYYILNEYQPQAQKSEKGLLSSLAFWRDDEEPQAEPEQALMPDAKYVIRVIAAGQGARIELQDLQGQAMSGPDAASLLGDINWQLQ